MEGIEQVTLKLFSRQLSALQIFKSLYEGDGIWEQYKVKLREICDQAQVEQLPSVQSSPPQYVSDPPIQHLLVLIPHFFASVNLFTPSH